MGDERREVQLDRSCTMCYAAFMPEVASRHLRNDLRGVLERVKVGEQVTITIDGEAVATLEPISRRPTWMRKDEFFRILQPADPAMAEDIRELRPDTTDDLPL